VASARETHGDPAPVAPLDTSRPTTAGRRHDLQRDERLGGHTIARHVARPDRDLRERLRHERLAAASTYVDLETAERVVAETLAQSASRIEAWQRRRGPRPNLALRYRGPRLEPIGRTLLAGRPDPVPSYDAVVILRWDAGTQEAYVLTSYPEVRR
jgi:hypothetical protein